MKKKRKINPPKEKLIKLKKIKFKLDKKAIATLERSMKTNDPSSPTGGAQKLPNLDDEPRHQFGAAQWLGVPSYVIETTLGTVSVSLTPSKEVSSLISLLGEWPSEAGKFQSRLDTEIQRSLSVAGSNVAVDLTNLYGDWTKAYDKCVRTPNDPSSPTGGAR